MPRKKAAPVAAPETTVDETPKCAGCGAVLGWRDTFYGREGRCKQCQQKHTRQALRGAFIPTAIYITELKRQKTREMLKPLPTTQPGRHLKRSLRKRLEVAA